MTEAQEDRARYVRTLLAFHGHNQTHLGRILGISQQAAGLKLRGQSRFSVEQLERIADAYGLDPGHLLKPPPLEGVLGSVRSAAGTLLTCTYRQVRRSGALFARLVQTPRSCQPYGLTA